MLKQRSLKSSVQLSGVGLHTGKTVTLTLHPAAVNTGIVFRRVDLNPPISIPATTQYVSDTRLNTCLTNGNASISTVEHLLSALAGMGIDNAQIDLNGCEPPIMDGSAQAFVQLIQTAGIQEQQAAKQFLRIKRKVQVEEAGKLASLAPFAGFKVTMVIDFSHPIIAQTQQTLSIELDQTAYIEEISAARTFGFLSEYEFLQKNNLGLGASLENTVVLDETSLVNTEGLRSNAEFVKHKILDAIGDLYLLGHSLIGEFHGYKSGHALNHQLRQALLNDPTAWELVQQPSHTLAV